LADQATDLRSSGRAGNPIAMIASVGVHTVFLTFLAWIFASQEAGTTESPEVRSVGMAVVHRMPDRTKYVSEANPEVSRESDLPQSESAQSQPEDSAATSKKDPVAKSPNRPNDSPADDSENDSENESDDDSDRNDPAENNSPQDAAGQIPPWDLSAVAESLAGGGRLTAGKPGPVTGGGPRRTNSENIEGLVNGKIRLPDGRSPGELEDSELVPGRARAGLGAGRTTTQVFGVSGTGSTFVYVFDRSESMSSPGGAPLRASKSELIRSLDTLTERQQFQIIFYNDQAQVFKAYGDRTGLVLGEEATIVRAKQFVRQTTAIGGTEHEAALRMAIRLAPDVIFFLTDAKIQTMSGAQLDEINRRAESAGTTIHGIQFGSGPKPSNSFVERLAKQNNGGYRYFDTTNMQ
jgi:hypothetical protein